MTAENAVAFGVVVTDLTLNDDMTQKPGDHQVWFEWSTAMSRRRCRYSPRWARSRQADPVRGCRRELRFSSKPPEGYPDYHAKIAQYVEILSHPARALTPDGNGRTYRPIETTDESRYSSTPIRHQAARALSLSPRSWQCVRSQLSALVEPGPMFWTLSQRRVLEIHLFDGDRFFQHNAFRAPGAASLEDLRKGFSKVDYYADIYSRMRRGVIPHQKFIEGDTVHHLEGFDFVFVCVDRPAVRKTISEYLKSQNITFVDVGMELELIEESHALSGLARLRSARRQSGSTSQSMSLLKALLWTIFMEATFRSPT